MAHTFLMEAGRWKLKGNWIERRSMPTTVIGNTIVDWGRENWFTIVTRLAFPKSDREDISFQYRGHLDRGERQYAFVLQHSVLGRVEGEGWVTPELIVQRYWVLNDRQRRSGFETRHQLDENTYYLSGSIMAGHYMTSVMEATLERQIESPYSSI
ncbi:hypothetical protein [Lyngbya aestuarii]|uniref:hypothetical protein n=1 Tax=Lyngbya aestuarii TaxID=118322 RepID=UPI00403D7A41